jgi:hypothetical protein
LISSISHMALALHCSQDFTRNVEIIARLLRRVLKRATRVRENKMKDELTASTTVAEANGSRAVANRNNAMKSTGPKSAEGKAVVATNGIGHGIYALCPVIEGVESAADWKRYRKAMLASLLPVGMVEVTLAERIILNAWRQQRVIRYETEQIRAEQREGPEQIGSRYDLRGRDEASAEVEELLSEPEWREREWNGLKEFAGADENVSLVWEDAYNLLGGAHLQLGLFEGFDEYWQRLSQPEVWTVGLVRQLLGDLAKKSGQALGELMDAMIEQAGLEFARSSQLARKLKQDLDAHRREHLLPHEGTLEKIMRYEAHLSRQLHRDLHELQRLQAMRHGLAVAVPMAIDIDLAGRSDCNTTRGR